MEDIYKNTIADDNIDNNFIKSLQSYIDSLNEYITSENIHIDPIGANFKD